MVNSSLVAVHGIGNYRPLPEAEAKAELTTYLDHALNNSLREYEPTARVAIHAAYYAHLLRPRDIQGTDDKLTVTEAQLLAAWAGAVGVPEEIIQGRAGIPLRLVCEWIARWIGRGEDMAYRRALARSVVNLIRDVAAYLGHSDRREQVRKTVANTIREHKARVVIAHSLGSVVTYETLWANSDLSLDLLVTVGSPLGVPGAIFDRLQPAPLPGAQLGTGERPPGVRRWINIADLGDLVAVPRPLHERFRGLDADDDHEVSIGPMAIHGFSRYLSTKKTISVLADYFLRE